MTDALLDRLAAANQVAQTTTPEAELAALLASVLPADPEPRAARPIRHPRRGGRRLRDGVAAALVLAAVGVATAGATSQWFGAHTGRSSATREPGDGSEILRNHGAGIGPIIDAFARDIPLPPGGNFNDFKARTAADEAAQQSTTGLRASMEFTATCQWTRWWLDARTNGDTTRMARAVRVLGDASNWPATNAATYPGDAPSNARVATPAARGDAAPVRSFYHANCTP